MPYIIEGSIEASVTGNDPVEWRKMNSMQTTARDLLVVVDVQLDFCPGGTLAVPNGDQVIDVIRRIAPQFDHIVATQDWHPPGHVSFASAHPGRRVFETIETPGGPQTLWPDHCIQCTPGAEIHPALRIPRIELILRKGCRLERDSYSAFFENDRKTPVGLAGYMRDRGLDRAVFVGLAYDYCVGYSALDARSCGFAAVVIADACRAINKDGSLESMEIAFRESGVVVTGSDSVSR